MMKPSEDDYTCNTLATSPSKETSRPHRSRPILHLFLEREDVTSAISMDKQTTSTRDDLSSKGQTSKDSDYLPHGESIIQKFRPMLQSFFERESERKLNAARPTMLGKDSETKGSSLESVASSHSTKNSTRTSDDDNDSVWRSYRRDTLSRNGSGDHSNNEHLATTLRRRSSLGVAASVTSDVSLSLGSLNDKTEIEKSNSASRGMSHPEQRKSRWYKNKFFLIPACFVVIVVFCLFSAIPLVKRKNSSSTNTSFTYTNQQTDGTSVTVGSTSSPHMHPSKQPSSGNVVISGKSTVPTSKPVSTKSSLTNPTKTPVSNPTKFPIAYPTKAPVVVPTKAPVLNPTTVTPPSSVQSSATDCFLTVRILLKAICNFSVSLTINSSFTLSMPFGILYLV